MANIQNLQGSDTLKVMYPKVNQNLQNINQEVTEHKASTSAHKASEIHNDSPVTGSKVSNALNTLQNNHNNHIASTTAHQAQNIPYTGNIAGATQVKQALDNIKTELNNAVLGAGDSSAEAGAARPGINGESNTALKDRLDKMESNIGKVTNVSVDTVLVNSQRGIVNVTTGNENKNITLPAAGTAAVRFTIKKIDSGTGFINVICNGAQLIDGEASKTIKVKDDSITMVSNGTGWNVVAETKSEKPQYSVPIMSYETAVYLGMNVVEGQISGAIFGNTYTNALGDDGSFTTGVGGVGIGWVNSLKGAIPTIENGKQKIVTTVSDTSNDRFIHKSGILKPNTCYFASIDVETDVNGRGQLKFYDDSGVPKDATRIEYGARGKSVIKFITGTTTTLNSVRCHIATTLGVVGTTYFDNFILVEISQHEFNNLTTDQLLAKYTYVSGTKSTGSVRLRSTGKNLFDNYITPLSTSNAEKTVLSTGIKARNTTALTFRATRMLLRLKPNTLYRLRRTANRISGTSGGLISVRDESQTVIINELGYGSGGDGSSSFTTPSNGIVVIFFFSSGGTAEVGEVDFTNLILSEGSDIIPYEPHVNHKSYLPEVGKSLPNGVKDEISDDGKLTKRVSDEVVINGIGNWSNLNSSQSNVYDARITNWTVGKNLLLNTANSAKAVSNDGDYTIIASGVSTANSRIIQFEGSDSSLRVAIEKSKVDAMTGETTLDKFKAYLNQFPVTLIYQLQQPIITQLTGVGSVKSYPGGHVFFDKVIPEVGFYNNGLSITHTAYPMKSTNPVDAIDFICKVDKATGAKVYLDVSQAVINANRLSFTHPGLISGDLVDWDYFYPPELSTEAEKKISWPINLSATASDALNIAVSAEKTLLDFVKYQRAINIKTDMRLSLLESGGA